MLRAPWSVWVQYSKYYQTMAEFTKRLVTGCGGPPASLFQGGEWIVEDIASRGLIDGSHVTFRFGMDGYLVGRTGCNTYRARYELTGERLIIGDIATTHKKACAPALERQEAEFVRLLGDAHDFDITLDGALLIRTAGGTAITACR